MSKTSNSASTPYATPADYVNRIDWTITGDLVRTDGGQSTIEELQSDPRLAAALADASGLLESACLAGQFYTVADLQSLTGNSLSFLKRIVCGLAINYVRQLRGIAEESDAPQYKEAKAFLEQLRSGERIFAFAETEAAGLPTTQALNPAVNQPSLVTLNNRMFPQSGRCYPGLR